jgi:hypothetical protein
VAKNISLILQRFKDLRTSILTLTFDDSPTFNNNGCHPGERASRCFAVLASRRT